MTDRGQPGSPDRRLASRDVDGDQEPFRVPRENWDSPGNPPGLVLGSTPRRRYWTN